MSRALRLSGAGFAIAVCSTVLIAAPAAAAASCNDTGDEWKVCEQYPRGTQLITLYYGIEFREHNGWGFEHISLTHGWSREYDGYVRTTLATAESPDPEGNGKLYYEANPNNEPGCEFTVIVNPKKNSWEPASRGIESAYGNGLCGV